MPHNARDLRVLSELVHEVQGRHSLEDLLQLIAVRAAGLLGVERVSIRLLDPSRKQLLPMTRAGEPLHSRRVEFKLGEGLLGWIAEHGESVRIADADADPRFAPRGGMRDRIGAYLGVPLLAGQRCMGVMSVVGGDRPFDERAENLLTLIAAVSAPYIEIARLSRLSSVDPLTGALNRWGLDRSFPEVAGLPEEDGAPLSVVMVDIDHFKAVNDEYGHATGDTVLKHVATLLAAQLRSGDAIVRYGGEEFLLVLPGVDLAQAGGVAERARQAVERQPAPVGGDWVTVTVSMGVVQRRTGETRAEVIDRADRAMYKAKQAGRNQVVSVRDE